MLTFLNFNQANSSIRPTRLIFQQAETPKAGPEGATAEKKDSKKNADIELAKAKEMARKAAEKFDFQGDLKNPDSIRPTGNPEFDKAVRELSVAMNKVEVSNNALQLARMASQYIDARGSAKARLRPQILVAAKAMEVARGQMFSDRHVGSLLVQRAPEGKPDGYMIVIDTGKNRWDTVIIGSAKPNDFSMDDTQMRAERKAKLERERRQS